MHERRALCSALVLMFLLALVGCKRAHKAPPVPAVSTTPTALSPAVSTTPTAVPSAVSTTPTAVPSASAPAVSYTRYANARFGFSLLVPTFLTAEPPPGNGDGRTFKGRDVELAAWGMHEVLSISEMCTKEPGATARTVDKRSCWQTGLRKGRIFWKRTLLVDSVYYSITLSYPESMKAEMDPVVTKVNASWTQPRDGVDHGMP